MATGLPPNAASDSNVDFDTLFDLSLSTKQITITDNSLDASGVYPSGNVYGYVWVVDSDGNTRYANDAFDDASPDYSSPDITRAFNATGTNSTTIPLWLNISGLVPRDTYTVYLLLTDSDSSPTTSKIKYKAVDVVYNYVAPNMSVQIDINVYTPSITFTDLASYQITGATGNYITPVTARSWTFAYPQFTNVPDVVNTSSTFTVGAVYTGTSLIKLVTTNTYSIGSDDNNCAFEVKDQLTEIEEVVVKDSGLCAIYNCVKEIFRKWKLASGTIAQSYFNNTIAPITALRQQIREAVQCGSYSDVQNYLDQLATYIDCDCECDDDTPTRLTGINTLVSGSDKITDTLGAVSSYAWSALEGLVYSSVGQTDFLVFIDGQEISSTYSTITFTSATGTIDWGVTVPSGTLITIQKLPYIS